MFRSCVALGASQVPRRSFAAALWLLGLTTLASFGGCLGHSTSPDFGKLPTITSDDPKAEADLREARKLDEAGNREAAAERYRAFIAHYAHDPLVPVAQLALGRIELRNGRPSEAKALFDQVAKHPDASLSEQGRFYGAVASHRLGDDKSAVIVLQPMVGRPVDPSDTSLLLRTLAESLQGLERYGDAIAVLDTLASESVPELDRRWAEAQIIALTNTKASAEDIDRLERDLPHGGVAWKHVVRRALRDADAAGKTDRAHELLEVMRDQDLPIDDELAAIAMRAERPTEANPQVIGAVLPLSGRGRKVGELALRGLMLAAGLPLSGPPANDTPQIVFRDDGGDPERAADAVSDLVSGHRAIAIIGPLDVRASEAAAARAGELGVPIVLLSPGAQSTARGPMVYRFFPSVDDEISELLGQAKARNRKRVAALLPEGPYGDLMEATLRAQAKPIGLEVGSVVRYPAGVTAFGEQTAALAKQPFDTLLLADEARQISLIAPALAAAGLWCTPRGEQPPKDGRAITVIAPAVAFDHGLARTVGRYLQGALFSVPFDAQTASGAGQQFVERFQTQFGEPPDAFAAFAHDAYALVRKSVDSGNKTRKALADGLWRVEAKNLAGPSAGLTAEHQPRNPTRVLQLLGDDFAPLAERK
jgi:ABC-type branched-subunit amino acid transport system substrate-binding protein